jgi:hypothetical protein
VLASSLVCAKYRSRKIYFWSRRQESNPQPSLYKSVALPLSYVGVSSEPERFQPANITSFTYARQDGSGRLEPLLDRQELVRLAGILIRISQDLQDALAGLEL